MRSGLTVLVVVLVAATAFGLWRRLTDGRIRGANGAPTNQAPTAGAAANGTSTLEPGLSAADLAGLLASAVAAHSDPSANPGGTGVGRLAQVLARCSFLVDGDPVGLRDHARVQLRDGAVVEALPPFAGG